MAQLDISEILEDPDLCSTFSVIRRDEVLSLTGRASYVETQVDDIIGVVTPGDPGKLLRKDDSQMTDNVITVSTTYKIRASGFGFQADVILYGGMRYTVNALKRWVQMGNGWYRAACTSETAADPAP